nr:ArsA-related P-loop ATPase [Nakamurella aerolata]
MDLRALVADPTVRVLVTCGSGGVGKTTTAAALAVAAADAGRKAAVLTIDPAKRLAQSLGVGELDNTPRRVELDTAGADHSGELWAMMLDTKRTFDDMVAAHSTPERAAEILENPFYQAISTSFSGTQEYMAMEKLANLAATGEYDLIVVDTPPSRSSLDFLDAPQRLSAFMDGRMIRMLLTPGRGVMRVVGAGLTLFARAVRSVIGGQLLSDAAQFVRLFEDLFGGFRERAKSTYQLLRQPGTAFVVVATPESAALREASYFAERLRSDGMPLAGLVLNRTHPVDAAVADLPAASAETIAGLESDAERPAAELAGAALAVHAQRAAIAEQEKRMLLRVSAAHPELPVRQVPALPVDVHDVDDLRVLATRMGDG